MKSNPRSSNLRILLIDDQEDMLTLYRQFLKKDLNAVVTIARSAYEAHRVAEDALFDIVICDVKIYYRNAEYGGLILAEELARIFGFYAILLVSQVVNTAYVKQFDHRFSFMSKPTPENASEWFSGVLFYQIKEMIARQFAFVAMPFGDTLLDELYNKHIYTAIKKSGYTPKRLDKEYITNQITNKMMLLINDCHFFVYIADKKNCNVFFEAGYAMAFGKRSILCACDLNALPFDVRQHQCIEYKGDNALLARKLVEQITGMRKGM